MITIFDTNRNVVKVLPQLGKLGVDCIGRYIAFGLLNEEKHIKPDEARAIADAGMKLFLIYEIGARTATNVVAAKRDAEYARDYAHDKLGMGAGAAIYDCADFDAQLSDYSMIKERAGIMRSILAPAGYRNGLYANGYTCSRAKADGVIDFRWLTCSRGFLGTRQAIANGQYEILQALPTPIAGLDTDPDSLNVAVTDIGARAPFAASQLPAEVALAKPPAPAPQHPSIAAPTLLERIEAEFGSA